MRIAILSAVAATTRHRKRHRGLAHASAGSEIVKIPDRPVTLSKFSRGASFGAPPVSPPRPMRQPRPATPRDQLRPLPRSRGCRRVWRRRCREPAHRRPRCTGLRRTRSPGCSPVSRGPELYGIHGNGQECTRRAGRGWRQGGRPEGPRWYWYGVDDREGAAAIPVDSVTVRHGASREAAPTGTVALDPLAPHRADQSALRGCRGRSATNRNPSRPRPGGEASSGGGGGRSSATTASPRFPSAPGPAGATNRPPRVPASVSGFRARRRCRGCWRDAPCRHWRRTRRWPRRRWRPGASARSTSRSSRHRGQRKSPSARFRYAQRLQPPCSTKIALLLRHDAAL